MAGHFGEFQDIVWRDRLFIPQGIIGFQLTPQTDGTGGGELSMRAKQQVGLVTHGLTDFLAELNRAGNVGHRRFMAAANGVRACGVEFDGGEALFDSAGCSFSGHICVDPELGGIFAGFWVKIGVRPHPLVHLAAQKRPNRAIARLAQNVPAGNL